MNLKHSKTEKCSACGGCSVKRMALTKASYRRSRGFHEAQKNHAITY